MTRSDHPILTLLGFRWRRLLATLLAAATLLISIPLPAAAADPVRAENPYLLRNGERVYRLDLERLERLWSVVARRTGSASVTLHLLRDDREGALTPGPLFVLGQDDPLDALVPVGIGERVSLIDPLAWEEVVTWTVSATAEGLASTLVAGHDRVTSRFPWALAEPRPAIDPNEEPIEVEVNGGAIRLEPDILARLRQAVENGETIRDEELPPALHLLAGRFDDLPGFTNRVHGLYLAEARARVSAEAHSYAGPGTSHGCTSICIGCVASVVLSIGAYLALVASCGSALVSGGATAIACIAAFVGVQGTHFAVLGSCGRCYDCTQEPEE